jgi:hypothetical protein
MRRRIRPIVAVAATCATLAVPSFAPAARVSIIERGGPTNTAELLFEAGAREANDLRISQREAEGDFYEIELVDLGAALFPGPGCRGGGAPGTATTCRLHEPHGIELKCVEKICEPIPGVSWSTRATLVLGNRASALRSDSVTGVEEVVTGGPGDDLILTGAATDLVDSGAGHDVVRTGAARDLIVAPPSADGPDLYDLGSGGDRGFSPVEDRYLGDVIDYGPRQGGISFVANRIADDGAPGERDKVLGAEVVRGGAGDDLMVGAAERDNLFGGGGADRLLGRDGEDLLAGGAGADLLLGANGHDELSGLGPNSGSDVGRGGDGDDTIELGAGPDRAYGGRGRDGINVGGGNDTVVGGPGRDRIFARSGWDTIFVRDGSRDRVRCDAGRDVASADERDLLIAGCEQILGEAAEHLESSAHGRLWRNW